MEYNTTTNLCADSPSSTNRIYAPNLRGDIFPREFCRLFSNAHGLSFLLDSTAYPITGRILKIQQHENNTTATLNIFCRPKQLPRHLQGAVSPLSHPCTMFVPELIQTTATIQVESSQIDRSIFVYHHDTISDENASVYIQGMEDMYVCRYIFNVVENRLVFIVYLCILQSIDLL